MRRIARDRWIKLPPGSTHVRITKAGVVESGVPAKRAKKKKKNPPRRTSPLEIEVRHTGQGGQYGPWINGADAPYAVAEAACDEAIANDMDSGEIEAGGQQYAWRRARRRRKTLQNPKRPRRAATAKTRKTRRSLNPENRGPFRVVRFDNGRNRPNTGVVSYHRTLESAQISIDRANRSLQRRAGQSTSWHPLGIQKAESVSYTDGSTGTQWETVSRFSR